MLYLHRDDYGIWSWELRDGDEPVSAQGGFSSRDDAVEGVRRAFRVMGAEDEMEQMLFAAISTSREEIEA